MTVKVKASTKNKDHGEAVIDGAMTIYEAVKQKTALLKALKKYKKLDIDLSDVSEIDTAGVQLLILVKKTSEAEGKAVRAVSPSPAVNDVIGRYNLKALLA